MNWFLIGIIIFVIVYLFLNWFAKTSTKKIAQFLKRLAIVISIFLAAILAIGGKYIFSLPFLLILLSGLKIKGFTAFNYFNYGDLYKFLEALEDLVIKPHKQPLVYLQRKVIKF